MASFTLDDLLADIEEKYAPVIIDLPDGHHVRLRSPMRVGEKGMDQIRALQDKEPERDANGNPIEEPEETTGQSIARIEEILKIAVGDKHRADYTALVKAFKQHDPDDYLALLMTVLDKYNGGAQLGEASRSEDSSESTEAS